jgi:hypothetical protein
MRKNLLPYFIFFVFLAGQASAQDVFKVIVENGEDKVIFDCGPTVLKGVFTEDMVPEHFRSSYKDIISKSFGGYTDESTNIFAHFAHEDFAKENRYIVKIIFNTKFYSFEKDIEIPLMSFSKDRVDYLEEKLSFLTSKMESMELILNEVMGMTINKHKFSTMMAKEIEETDSTVSSTVEDLSDSDQEEEQSKTKKKGRQNSKSSNTKVSKRT